MGEGIIRTVMQCTDKILCFFSPTNSQNLPHRSPDMAKYGVFSVCLHSVQKELPFSRVSYFDQCRVMVDRDDWDEYLKYCFCFFIWRMKTLFHSYLCTRKWKQDLINELIERNADHSLQVEILSDVSNACGCPCRPLTHPSPSCSSWPLWNTHSFPMPLCYPISLLGCNVNNSEVLMSAFASQTVK